MTPDLVDVPAAEPWPPAGLSTAEALARSRSGRANISSTRSSRSYGQVLRANLLTLFNSVLYVIGAALLALGRTDDAVISVGLGLLNALIGSVQELRAKRTLDRLRLLQRGGCTVVRDGAEHTVDPECVVHGDLLRLRPGDQVVVDGPVVGPGRLEVDESLLTGEAEPVGKVAGDRLLSGAYCVSGEALQRAEAVGDAGYAAVLTRAARTWTPRRTPLQQQVELVLRADMGVVALVAAAVLLGAALDGLPLVRLVQIAAVLSGLVPYGLFFVTTVAYASGAAALSRHGALVQQLNAVESLSHVDVVCTDKTGTLTTGRLVLRELVRAGPPGPVALLLGDVVHSATARNATGEALARALPGQVRPVREEVPFSSARRWSAVAFGDGAGVYVLGAPELLLRDAPGWAADVDDRARQGLRVLVLAEAAHGAVLHDVAGRPALPAVQPLALVVLADELRPHVREAVEDFRRRGVAVKVVSGDDPRTVAALAAQLGLHDDAPLTGEDLTALSPVELEAAAAAHTVFGRIAPEQKEQLVDALRRRGSYVAMIGDGVNDTRALKRAHLGIALQSGSSVTRDVADLVLLDDSFAALAVAQLHGRRIISGISASLHLFLTRVVTSVLVIVGVSILGLGFPYEPAQVGLTLFTVGVPSLVLTACGRPLAPDPRLLVTVGRFVLVASVVTAVFGVGLYAVLHQLVEGGLRDGVVPLDAVQRFEAFTGLMGSDTSFAALAATGVAQTGLSMFTALTGFLLIVFLAPPSRGFTGWVLQPAGRRPALLASGLLLGFLAVLLTPALADYFQLLRPDLPLAALVLVTTLAWFFVLRSCWRHHLLERLLGLPHAPHVVSVDERRRTFSASPASLEPGRPSS